MASLDDPFAITPKHTNDAAGSSRSQDVDDPFLSPVHTNLGAAGEEEADDFPELLATTTAAPAPVAASDGSNAVGSSHSRDVDSLSDFRLDSRLGAAGEEEDGGIPDVLATTAVPASDIDAADQMLPPEPTVTSVSLC